MENYKNNLQLYNENCKKLVYPLETIWHRVKRTADKYPRSTALMYLNKKITYEEMTKKIERLHSALVSAGVRKGDRVMVCLPDIPQAVYLLYAINRMGAVACFVHPLSSEREVADYIKLTKSTCLVMLCSLYERVKSVLSDLTVILTSPFDEAGVLATFSYNLKNIGNIKSAADLQKSSQGIFIWKDLMNNKEGKVCDCVPVSCFEPAVILFSGGTTGKSKGVVISSFALNAMGVQTGCVCGCNIKGKVMLTALPFYHGFGLGVCVHAVLICGGSCALVPRFSAEVLVKSIKKYRPNFLCGVPTMFEAILRCDCKGEPDLSCLRGVFCGGDSLTENLRNKFDGYLKERGATVRIREGYGLTECVAVSCLTPENSHRKHSIGLPLPDMSYKICKVGTTDEMPLGEEGEICITGPTLMLSYLDDRAETDKAIRLHKDNRRWLHTGDAGVMDGDGYVYFRQRIKRMIISSGYNVYPNEIEELMCAHPSVERCFVVGVKDSYKMQRIKAFVVVKEGVIPSEGLKDTLFEYCRENLPRHTPVSEIEFLDTLPVTSCGKIDCRKLENMSQVP